MASSLEVCKRDTGGFLANNKKKKGLKKVGYFHQQAVSTAILSWLIHEHFGLIGLWSNRSQSFFIFCRFCVIEVRGYATLGMTNLSFLLCYSSSCNYTSRGGGEQNCRIWLAEMVLLWALFQWGEFPALYLGSYGPGKKLFCRLQQRNFPKALEHPVLVICRWQCLFYTCISDNGFFVCVREVNKLFHFAYSHEEEN